MEGEELSYYTTNYVYNLFIYACKKVQSITFTTVMFWSFFKIFLFEEVIMTFFLPDRMSSKASNFPIIMLTSQQDWYKFNICNKCSSYGYSFCLESVSYFFVRQVLFWKMIKRCLIVLSVHTSYFALYYIAWANLINQPELRDVAFESRT